MAKKSEINLSYLYLSILAFVTAIGLEVVSEKYAAFTLPDLTMKLTISAIYVLSASMLLAFLTSLKISREQRYVLYLVVLALTFFRVITFLKGSEF